MGPVFAKWLMSLLSKALKDTGPAFAKWFISRSLLEIAGIYGLSAKGDFFGLKLTVPIIKSLLEERNALHLIVVLISYFQLVLIPVLEKEIFHLNVFVIGQ
jgi:hypothetical protein